MILLIPTLPEGIIDNLASVIEAVTLSLVPLFKQKCNLLLLQELKPSAIIALLYAAVEFPNGVHKYKVEFIFSFNDLITIEPPNISNFCVGLLVPIPTKPELLL